MPIRDRLRAAFRRRSAAIDTHDVGAFRRVIGRTGLIRLVLAGSALALVLAAAASARDPAASGKALIAPDRVGVVIVDLSLSITDEDLVVVRRTFRRLVAEDATIGLVVFSDAPYEMLPPGVPGSELKPMLRLLVGPRLGPIRNPWTQTFRAGTRISAALELARSMLERDQVAKGSILLVSDLETAPDDVPALVRKIAEIEKDGIELGVVPLNPSSDAVALFSGHIDKQALTAFATQAPDAEQPDAGSAGVETPIALLVLGFLAFLVLAVHERFSSRLALPRPAAADEGVS